MEIRRPTRDRLEITLRQRPGEVVAFLLMVMLIAGAVASSAPETQRVPAVMGILALGVCWGVYSLRRREYYVFENDGSSTRLTASGSGANQLALTRQSATIVAVRAECIGVDDDRLVVTLEDASGRKRSIPRRMTSLTAHEQAAFCAALRDFTGLRMW